MSALALLQPQLAPSWGDHAYVPRLRDVVGDLMHKNRITYSELASKTGIASSTLHKIAAEQNRHMPKTEHLDKMALALGVHPRVLHEAAAESYGVQVAAGSPDPGTDRTLIDNIVRLDDRRKAQVAALVEQMLKDEDDS